VTLDLGMLRRARPENLRRLAVAIGVSVEWLTDAEVARRVEVRVEQLRLDDERLRRVERKR
jgi:hypothetical protein